MGVSKNRGTPKSSILIGFSIINHLFWDTPIFGNIQMMGFGFCFAKSPGFFRYAFSGEHLSAIKFSAGSYDASEIMAITTTWDVSQTPVITGINLPTLYCWARISPLTNKITKTFQPKYPHSQPNTRPIPSPSIHKHIKHQTSILLEEWMTHHFFAHCSPYRWIVAHVFVSPNLHVNSVLALGLRVVVAVVLRHQHLPAHRLWHDHPQYHIAQQVSWFSNRWPREKRSEASSAYIFSRIIETGLKTGCIFSTSR